MSFFRVVIVMFLLSFNLMAKTNQTIELESGGQVTIAGGEISYTVGCDLEYLEKGVINMMFDSQISVASGEDLFVIRCGN